MLGSKTNVPLHVSIRKRSNGWVMFRAPNIPNNLPAPNSMEAHHDGGFVDLQVTCGDLSAYHGTVGVFMTVNSGN